MPKYGPFLPNIYNLIYQTLEQNNLTPDFYFTEENFYKTLETQRFFVAPATDSSGNKYIFKARIEDYPETKKIFNRERKFVEYASKNKIPGLNTPHFIKSGNKPLEWFLYDYIELYSSGNILGPWEKNTENFPIEDILNNILSLQKNTKNIIANEIANTIPIKNSEKIIKEFDKYNKTTQDLVANQELSKIRNILIENKKLLDDSTIVIAHGDLHPGNMIINADKPPFSLVIIDWANIQLNNYVYDIAFLWAVLILYPHLQYKLTQNFVEASPNIENFDHLFKLNLIRIIPQLIDIFNFMAKNSEEKFNKQIELLLREFKIIRYSENEVEKSKKKILSKLKLSEIKSLRKAELNNTPDFEVSLCKNKKTGVDFILKIMHRDYIDLKNRFEKEAEITKFFTKNKKDICLQYAGSNMKSRPEWFVYKFLEGEKIGNFYRISPKFLTENLTKSVFSDILEVQKEYDKMTKNLKKSLEVNLEEKKNKLSNDIDRMVKNGFVPKEIAEKNKIIYNENINKIPLFLNHNDLHPENLIINNKSHIRIIDFNLASLSSQFFDFLTFILCGWENKKWIEKSMQKLYQLYPELKKKDSITRLSFNLSLIEVSVKLILQAFPDRKDPDNLSREIKYSNSAQQYFIEIFKNLNLFL